MSMLDDILASNEAEVSAPVEPLQELNPYEVEMQNNYYEQPYTKYDTKVNSVEAKAAIKNKEIYNEEPQLRSATDDRNGNSKMLSQFGSLDGGYSSRNGQPISNENKIYNTYNTDQLQSVWSQTYDQRIHTDPETGEKYQMLGSYGERTPWEGGETGFIYGGDSKNDKNMDKFGYSELGVKERYTPGSGDNGTYGWESGPDGIDADNAYMNWELPRGIAKQFEGVIHGNLGNLDARTMFDNRTEESALMRKRLGGGASEYYTDDKMSLLGGGRARPKGAIIKTEPDVNDGFIGENIDVAQSAALGLGAELQNMFDKTTGFAGDLTFDAINKIDNKDTRDFLTRAIDGKYNGAGKDVGRGGWLEDMANYIAPGEGNFAGTGRNYRDFLSAPDGVENKMAEGSKYSLNYWLPYIGSFFLLLSFSFWVVLWFLNPYSTEKAPLLSDFSLNKSRAERSEPLRIPQ